MVNVVVVGGGLAGCSAAYSASKAGADVTLVEKTDMLLGCALEAGNINGNGTFTFIEEAKSMGGGDFFEAFESLLLYKTHPLPGWERAYIYNLDLSEPTIRRLLTKAAIEIKFKSRAIDVKRKGNEILAVSVESRDYGKEVLEGDVFIDCSGTGGGIEICTKYGKGCVMCMLRCPTFGDRVSIATKMGAPELVCRRPDGKPGLLSSALCISKESVSPQLRAELEETGIARIPLPKELIDEEKGEVLTNPNLPKEHVENVFICNVGSRYKLIGQPYFPLDQLRKVPGFENVRVINWGTSDWNAIRYISMTLRDNALRVEGLTNLLCAGEKSGPVMGNDGAIITGVLAGHNAVRTALELDLLILPRTTAIGDFIAYTGEMMHTEDGLKHGGYSSQGGIYFKRMESLGLYTMDVNKIRKRIEENGLTGIFSKKLC